MKDRVRDPASETTDRGHILRGLPSSLPRSGCLPVDDVLSAETGDPRNNKATEALSGNPSTS